MIIDVLVIVFIILSFCTMIKKGFVKALASISGNLVCVIVIMAFLSPVTAFLSQTPIGETVRENVEVMLLKESEEDDTEEDEKSKGITPEIMKGIEEKTEEITRTGIVPVVTDTIMRIIALVLLIIVTKLLMWILFLFLQTIVKLPVLSGINKIAGGAAGIINALVIIYTICAVLTLNFDWTNDLRGIVDQTVVLKYFYINNILMNIFVH